MSFDNDNQNNNKNLFVALGLFLLFMFGFNYFFDNNSRTTTQIANEAKEEADESGALLDNEGNPDSDNSTLDEEEARSKTSRLYFENQNIKASVDLEGGVIDDVMLKNYQQTTEKNSKNVFLLTPKNTQHAFYYAISYKDKTNHDEINTKTLWENSTTSDENRQITIKTSTKNGLIVERTINIDDGYIIWIRDRLINVSDNSMTISNSANIVKIDPIINNYAVVHEGLVGINGFDNKVSEVKYSDVESRTNLGNSKWFGYTDIYWLIAHVNKSKNSVMEYSRSGNNGYNCSLARRNNITIDAKSAVDVKYSLFAGPKDIKILNYYAKSQGLDKFDMAIDFGWFFMLTKPLLKLLDVMESMFHNMGIVILLLTLMFKIITYPLMKKSLLSAAKMKKVQPKIALLQKSYAHDKQRMNQELMALYKKEQISPLSGCLPMLLQAPIFFCLYKVFFISIEMRHAPLFGWIHDLAAPDSLYFLNLFGLIDWTPPKILQIGVWPLIMGATMFLQQKISSAKSKNTNVEKTPEAKMQENMMYALPIVFTYICSSFPVGVVIYWTISNVFGIIQQYYINKSIDRRKK